MTREEAPAYAAGTSLAALPFWLSIIGGLIILLQGIFLAFVSPLFLSGQAEAGLDMLVLGLIVTVMGAVIMWAAYTFRIDPGRKIMYGALIAIVSVIALVMAGGGYFIGSILGIIGGSWTIMQR